MFYVLDTTIETELSDKTKTVLTIVWVTFAG